MKKLSLLVLIILSLPTIITIYQVPLDLGGFEHVLWWMGLTLSPLILFTVLLRFTV